MSERRVMLSLTESQARSLSNAAEIGLRTQPWSPETAAKMDDAIRELDHAILVYIGVDNSRYPSRLAAVPNLDAASLTEHDASSTETWR